MSESTRWFRIYTCYYTDWTVGTSASGATRGELVRVGQGRLIKDCLGDFKASSVWPALQQAWEVWNNPEAVITTRSPAVGDGLFVELLTEPCGTANGAFFYTVQNSGFTTGFSRTTSLL